MLQTDEGCFKSNLASLKAEGVIVTVVRDQKTRIFGCDWPKTSNSQTLPKADAGLIYRVDIPAFA
jgi:hypothetical protein